MLKCICHFFTFFVLKGGPKILNGDIYHWSWLEHSPCSGEGYVIQISVYLRDDYVVCLQALLKRSPKGSSICIWHGFALNCYCITAFLGPFTYTLRVYSMTGDTIKPRLSFSSHALKWTAWSQGSLSQTYHSTSEPLSASQESHTHYIIWIYNRKNALCIE